MAGALAGNALERILSSDPSADGMTGSAEAADDGPVEWFYSQDTEFVDSNGDGSVDAAWTSESLLIDDGTPALYSHTEYAEYADTDGDGVSDSLVTLESNVSYAEWGGDGTPDADIGWSDEGFDV
jgi:hypothetical protein